MASTTYAQNLVQDLMFGGVDFTPPSNYYLALSTTTVSVSGSNVTEPSGAGYERASVPNTKSYFTYSTSGCVVNSGSVVFPISSGSWGTIVDIAIMSGSTSGSTMNYATLSSPIIVQTNTLISFSASAITLSQS